MMKTQGVHLMTLTDTHLSRDGMGEVGTYLQQEGLGGGGIAATRETGEEVNTGTRRKAGIYYIWDPMKIQVSNIKEIYPSRVARAVIHHLDSGNELAVYGVYMPVRNNNGERIDEIWGNVMTDVTENGNRNFIINGDFNAESEAWIQKN
eukprot:2843601-Pleurochrysis_carterae.AAC.1